MGPQLNVVPAPERVLRERVSFAPPAIGDEEIAEVVDVLRSGWLTTGSRTRAFEEAFAAYVGAPGALALSSCTAAMHTALVALGVGPGDEVITSTMTFAASVNVIEHVGARPVLVDVEPDTLNLDPECVAEAITERTRAILPVHYAGHPAELDPIEELARSHGLVVLEDAAHAFPAQYRGRWIGDGANPTAFSFYCTKNLTTGEGGMLTADPAFLDDARVLSLHGMSRDAWRRYEKGGSWQYDVSLPGYKYNMSDIQAAIGLAQLRKIEAFQSRRRDIVRAYDDAFGGLDALELPVARPHVQHAWHLYVLRIRQGTLRIDRARFIEELSLRGIGASVHFIPMHLHSYYRDRYGYAPMAFPVAYENFGRLLSLPLSAGLSAGDVDAVIEAVLDIVQSYWR